MSIYSDRVLKDSPKLYLRLFERAGAVTAVDLSGNGHHGTYTGGVALGRPGLNPRDPATCAQFDGAATYVSVPKHDDLDPVDSGDFTVEAVFRPNKLDGTIQYICSNGALSYSLRINTSNDVELGVGGSALLWIPSDELTVGRVYHVIASGSTTTANVRLFFNGKPSTIAVSAHAVNDVADTDFEVGRRPAAGTLHFEGMVQEVAVYPDVILSAETMVEHYEAFLAAERVSTVFYIRDPLPPHPVLHQVDVEGLGYAHMLMEPSEATLAVPTTDPNLDDYAHNFQIGMACSVEREDGLLPFFGWLTKSKMVSGGGVVTFTARDHVGALLSKAHAPIDAPPLASSVADHIRRVFAQADARAHPPLLLGLDLDDGGPTVEYQSQGEYLDDFLRRMAEASGWEWALRHELSPRAASTVLQWRGRVGRDMTAHALWEEGRHFRQAGYTQNAAAFISSATAIGGGGAFGRRPAARVDTAGAEATNPVRRIAPGVDGGAGRGIGPLLGSRLLFLPNVTNVEALYRSAEREHDTPDHIREQLSFSLIADAIDWSYPPAPGALANARFSDILSGAKLTRVVRVLGVQLDPEAGTLDVEAKIERREQADAIT